MKKLFPLWLTVAAVMVLTATFAREASAIPAFARKYQTSCATCHSMFPKLNAFGEAFRLNGFQIPNDDEAFVQEKPVELAAQAWKEMWPQALWPSTIPGTTPIAVRLLSDLQVTRERKKAFTTNFEFPHEIEFFTGGTFGRDLGFFTEVEWAQGGGIAIRQGKVLVQNVWQHLLGSEAPLIPDRALNIWVGKMDQVYLKSYRDLERVGKSHPLWGNKTMADLTLKNPTTGKTIKALNNFRFQNRQPGIEANGILFHNFYYAAGVVQGNAESTTDDNNHKDFYYKLRYKFGGRALDGTLPGEKEIQLAPPATGGWVDNAIHLEHFGYFGKAPAAGDKEDRFDRFGVALQLTYQDLDLAGGYVWGRNRRPWGVESLSKSDYQTLFVKADYMIFPWLMAELRWEDLSVDGPADLRRAGFTQGSFGQSRFMPALIWLVRANMRVVLEGEAYNRHRGSELANESTPHNFWARLDFAF